MSCSASWTSRCSRGPAIGDVRQRPGDPRRVAVPSRVARPRLQYPAPLAVGVADAVLALEVVAAPARWRSIARAQPLHVVGMDEVEPRVRAGRDVPPRRSRGWSSSAARSACSSAARSQSQIPSLAALHRERVALLAAPAGPASPGGGAPRSGSRAQGPARRALPLTRKSVTPSREASRSTLVVALAGEQDHRRGRLAAERLAHQLQAGAGAEAVVDEVDVVACLADRREGRGVARAPVERRTCARSWAREQVAGDHEVVLVVLDEQDPQCTSAAGRRSSLRELDDLEPVAPPASASRRPALRR